MWDQFEMPETPEMLAAMLRYAYGRGRASGKRISGQAPPAPPPTVPCLEHNPTPVSDCLACMESSAYCPHHYLTLHFHGAEPGDACWRPKLRNELPL
jgi:hypothetical protein